MIRSTTQLGAIIRYEFLLQWRQRTLLASLIPLCLLCLLLVFGFRENVAQALRVPQVVVGTRQEGDVTVTTTVAAEPAQMETVRRQASTVVLLSLESVLHMVGLLLFPILMADMIPKDRQYGVRELLDTLPLPGGVYLGGKLFAAMLSALCSLMITLIVMGVAWWIVIYPYVLGDYLVMVLLAVLPVGLLSTGLIVLLAAGQPTRRRAILLGIGFAIASLVLVGFGLTKSIYLLDYFNPSRPLAFKYYVMGMSGGGIPSSFELVSIGQLALAVGAGILEVAVLWWFVRGQLRRKQS